MKTEDKIRRSIAYSAAAILTAKCVNIIPLNYCSTCLLDVLFSAKIGETNAADA